MKNFWYPLFACMLFLQACDNEGKTTIIPMGGGVSAPASATAYVYNYNFGNITSSSTSAVLIDITITPQSDGYIVVNAGGSFTISQTNVANNTVTFWIEKWVNGSRESSSTERSIRLDTTSSNITNITTPVHMTHVFAVTGGVACTFSLRALRDSTSINTASFNQRSSLQLEFIGDTLPCSNSICGSGCYGTCN